MIDLDQVAQRLKIAELAISHHNAKNEACHAKGEYHDAWRRFETGDDSEDGYFSRYASHDERICRNHPQFKDACIATKREHDIYKDKQREEYNARRRLENAIRRTA